VAQLQEYCAVLEAEAKAENITSANLDRAGTELKKIMHSLAGLSNTASENGSATGEFLDKDKLNAVLQTLVKQIEDYDTSALDTIEENKNLFATKPITEQRKLLGKSLEAYDFEASLTITHNIKSLLAMEEVQKSVAEDPEKLAQLLNQLAELLSDYDTDAMTLLENEEKCFVAAGLTAEYKEIAKALDKYDFNVATSCLEAAAKKHDMDL
jgi:hypothetical protein